MTTALAFVGLGVVFNFVGRTAARVADWWTAPGDEADHTATDTSPHPFDAVVTEQHDEYADAADGIPDDELPDWVVLEDGCHAYDHKLGRHRKGWLPEQRSAQ